MVSHHFSPKHYRELFHCLLTPTLLTDPNHAPWSETETNRVVSDQLYCVKLEKAFLYFFMIFKPMETATLSANARFMTLTAVLMR
jgi:hypothetical protein